MDPHSLEEILSSVIEIGKILEKQARAKEIQNELSKRIDHVKINSESKKPRVLAIEWLEPFFSAGHWIPEMISYNFV